MATVTLYPSEVYRFRKSDKVITERVNYTSSTVLSNDDDSSGYLILFDISNANQYGQVTNGSISASVDYHAPASDAVVGRLYFSKNVVQEIVVGQTFLTGGSENRPMILGDFLGGSGYYRANDGYVTTDNYGRLCAWLHFESAYNYGHYPYYEAKIHNIRISLTIGSAGAFTALSDYGGGYQDRTKALSIHLSAEYNATIFRQHEVASGSVKYKLTSASSYSSISFTGNTATVPANTFASGQTYDLYVACTSKAGSTSNTPAVRVSTVDGTAVVTPLSPRNEVVNRNVTFSWSYASETGSGQYGYDLQISTNNGSSWTTIKNHVITSQTTTTYTINTGGAILWRVRGYNQNNTAGSWSEAAHFVNNIPPNPPTINSVSGAGRQTVSWSSSSQIAYQMEVLDESGNLVYTSGEIYSTSGSALVNEYLPAGSYTFRVRIAGSVGGWSEWTSLQKTISEPLTAPVFTVTSAPSGALISVTGSGFTHYYIVKNGVPIANITETEYIDMYTTGPAEYRVIGVNNSDQYGSSTQMFSYVPDENRIITADGEIISCSERWNERSYAQRQITPKMSTYEYIGENLPSHVFAGKAMRGTFSVSAFDRNNSFESLIGKPVYFSSKDGWGGWCVVTGLSRTEQMFGSDTALTLDMDNYSEAIEYAV